jgi:hypothetical protein
MPKFHFPIVDGTKLTDPVGLELRDLDQAKTQAELIARHIALTHGKPRSVLIEDESGVEIHKQAVRPDKPVG